MGHSGPFSSIEIGFAMGNPFVNVRLRKLSGNLQRAGAAGHGQLDHWGTSRSQCRAQSVCLKTRKTRWKHLHLPMRVSCLWLWAVIEGVAFKGFLNWKGVNMAPSQKVRREAALLSPSTWHCPSARTWEAKMQRQLDNVRITIAGRACFGQGNSDWTQSPHCRGAPT